MKAWDIAYDSGDIWVACDAPGTPILRFDEAGSIVDQIESTLVPSATGLTLDDEGYLWASDNINGLIYKIDLTGTGVEESGQSDSPETGITLSCNPVTSTCAVSFHLQQPLHAVLQVYDLSGILVDVLVDGDRSPGYNSVMFDVSGLSAGAYFIRLAAGEQYASRICMVLR